MSINTPIMIAVITISNSFFTILYRKDVTNRIHRTNMLTGIICNRIEDANAISINAMRYFLLSNNEIPATNNAVCGRSELTIGDQTAHENPMNRRIQFAYLFLGKTKARRRNEEKLMIVAARNAGIPNLENIA
jgi:hypothetical protein